jgi:hypothetical protein
MNNLWEEQHGLTPSFGLCLAQRQILLLPKLVLLRHYAGTILLLVVSFLNLHPNDLTLHMGTKRTFNEHQKRKIEKLRMWYRYKSEGKLKKGASVFRYF